MKFQEKYHFTQYFDNGYGVSVISNDLSLGGSLGLFELAVMYNGNIVYDTPITPDVLGYLTFHGVAEIIDRVRDLPERTEPTAEDCWDGDETDKIPC